MPGRRYEGKIAVVTGGALGIGSEIARGVVAEGGSVVVGDLSESALEALAKELGEGCRTVVADVRKEADLERLVAIARDEFGALDAGFNVAGAARFRSLVNITDDEWDFTLDICLKGVLWAMKHEGRHMIEQGHGAIVNVASLNSEVPMFGNAAYCVAKAGVAMLSQCGALEYGEHGVRVNTISPGLTETRATAELLSDPAIRDLYLERIPMKRAAAPSEIAAGALYLGSEDASYVSGSNLFVDGAWAQSGYPDLRPSTLQSRG